MTISTPGLHIIREADYHADPCPKPSLSNSLIRTLVNRSPRHAWLQHPRLNPLYAEKESDRFDKGSAAHALLLEGNDKCVVVDADDWRKKESQQLRDDARARGMLPLLRHQHDDVCAMVSIARSFMKDAGIGDGWLPERTLVWKTEGGVWCRGRLDLTAPDHLTVLDYKTTSCSSPDEFMRSSIIQYGYHTQDEFYCQGMVSCGMRRPKFLFLVQEDTMPYACYLVENSPSMLELAERTINKAERLWQRCLSSDSWPAYPAGVYVADAPVWAVREMEAQS